MTTRLPALLALPAILGFSACDPESVLGPIEPDEVGITLAVTGGLAGADYSFEVDGTTGQVRGLRCVSLCDFLPGEILVTISDERLAGLAARLEDAGVIGLDGTDFGTGCCDFFHVDLTYQRGERASRVLGTEDQLPEELAVALRILHPLARGTVPLIVSPETRDSDWPRDAYTLGDVVVEGTTLTADVTYSGGCESHAMDLVAWGGWLESFPVQVNALITHDDGDDPCDAIVTEERSFDVFPLAEAYLEAYGETGGPTVVILRLWDPGESASRSIEVQL